MFPTGSTHGIKGAMAWHGTLPGGTQEAADRSLVEAPFRHSWCGASTVCCTCTMTKAILLHLSLRNTNPGFPLISGSTCCLPRKDDPKPHRARSVPKRHHHWTRLHTTRGPLTSSHLSDVDLDGSMVFGSDDPVAGRAANTHTHTSLNVSSPSPVSLTFFLAALTISAGRTGPQIHRRRSACWSSFGCHLQTRHTFENTHSALAMLTG